MKHECGEKETPIEEKTLQNKSTCHFIVKAELWQQNAIYLHDKAREACRDVTSVNQNNDINGKYQASNLV